MLNMAKSGFQMLLVDDPVGGLDDTGTEHFCHVLRRLADEGAIPQIFCTVPRAHMLQGDATLNVVKKSRASYFA